MYLTAILFYEGLTCKLTSEEHNKNILKKKHLKKKVNINKTKMTILGLLDTLENLKMLANSKLTSVTLHPFSNT